MTKRAMAAWAMASATRVVCNKEGNGNGGKSNGDKGGRQATATRAIANRESKQQSISNRNGKGGRWLARDC